MGKAKWWVCPNCSSLNDLPAGKCYKCGTGKPSDPTLIDDTYSEVSAGKRVGISVDRSLVSELVKRDPVETQTGGGIIDAFGADVPDATTQPPRQPTIQPYDPYASEPVGAGPAERLARAGIPPLRDPTPRGIEQVGGRHWTEGLQPQVAPQSPTPQAPMAPAAPQAPMPPPPMPPPAAAPPPPMPPPAAGPPVRPNEPGQPPPPLPRPPVDPNGSG